ncbi:pyruvate carboxyltransferase [Denitrovibrio acetiphilus DSM 12809]|uniref:Homocitrate synthase n=1 Tax=Denitrovibrio acetiphilus (strain DSM 12809 / NBRC 114555 / N2460) TaxID=522772 RepID=D4H6W4_DENA2|nr:homocitrate synthase [Denitrovibrio acetiphilus]ADD67830.1 pyruvate carboxyltransferase [Denitrovibrio acetiphilus DSM 12809]
MIIDDTTLRDGEQTPGVAFSRKEKLTIVKHLDAIGVQEIEAGIPVMGLAESRMFESIMELGLDARIIAWNRALIGDVQASIAAGANSIEISLPMSDVQINTKLNKTRGWILDQVKSVLDFCANHDLYISVGGEDASRADFDFLAEYIRTIEAHGADRFRFCDTVGILDPFKTYELTAKIREITSMDIEIHTHNDFGMATANALAAVRAGATHVNTTVIGLGERAGNAPLEEIIMASRHVYGMDDAFDTKTMRSLSEYVAQAAGRNLDPQRPVIGEFMFTHESGIHTDGVLKNPKNYEAFDPAELNMQRNLVFGNQSGLAVLKYILEQEGIVLESYQLTGLLHEAKKLARKNKAVLNKAQVIGLYSKVCNVVRDTTA